MKSLGDRLVELRFGKGLSQDALHHLSGIAKQTIYDIERGATKTPNAHTLAKLAGALGVEIGELLGSSAGIYLPNPVRLEGARRPFADWNAPMQRRMLLEQISPALIPDPLEITRFIDHRDVLSDFAWLNEPSHIQTSTMEYSDLWSDPSFFGPFEASLLHFDKAGRQVDRLFQFDWSRRSSPAYIAAVKQVLLRHRALGFRPRIVRLDEAGSMHRKLGAACDFIVILDGTRTLIGNYPIGIGPVFLQSENLEFAQHASNVFLTFWKGCPGAEAFLQHYPPTAREKSDALKEAELVQLAYDLSRGLDSSDNQGPP